jgi:hypothetical protein
VLAAWVVQGAPGTAITVHISHQRAGSQTVQLTL